MKKYWITAILLGVTCTSCGNKLQETMDAIDANNEAIRMSTYAVHENAQAIHEATIAIEENRRQINSVNQTLKQAH